MEEHYDPHLETHDAEFQIGLAWSESQCMAEGRKEGASCSQLSVNPWTVAQQAPLSLGFPRQEYWSGRLSFLQGTLLTQG